jgi:hypothetical protein
MKWQPSHPVHLFMGLLIWSIWFVAIYGLLSLGCYTVSDRPLHSMNSLSIILIALTGITASILLALGIWCWRTTAVSPFFARVAAGVYFAAFVATLAVGSPATALPPCH